ncbi:hypothetical protein [Mucilaginibacter lacusdianchii]|uniref:hypothetical protein n=1 Tax=Mucilaginibacter lacusdianchii TaxID=2684211 RepID=UPI00131E4004|nr:hypothetical protein [Mucilaginibacter sp. JXJ CY 39]
MKTITEKEEQYILISDQTDFDEIIECFTDRQLFANQFKFSDRSYFTKLLNALNIDDEDFSTRYYYYDPARKLHISESEFGYVWISTYGLIARNKATANRAVNACLNQHMVILMLIEKAIDLVNDNRVYDIDSYKFSLLSKLSPTIFHNVTFYIEVFCKAYLSLTGTETPHSHNLLLIYQTTLQAMNNHGHGNSLFQIIVLEPLFKIVEHVAMLPRNFKEHFIKYDDNLQDDTIILYDAPGLAEMKSLLELSVDFISGYYYEGAETHYLRTDVYQRMMDMADTDEKKAKIQELYPHLIPR